MMNDREVMLALAQRYADGIANAEEVSRLQAVLQDDVDARRAFREYMELDAALVGLGDAAALCDAEALRGAESGDQPTQRPASGPHAFRIRWSMGLAASACLSLLVGGLWLGGWGLDDKLSGGKDAAVWATVMQSVPGVTIVRGADSRPASAGDQLQSDESIVVTGDSMAKVSVAKFGVATLGPDAHLRLGTEPRLVELGSGFALIAAETQDASRPWRVRTPQVEAAVIGTKFSIASSQGRTALRVTEGVVQLTDLQGELSERVGGGNRAFVRNDIALDVPASLDIAPSRSGGVLLLTSREPLHAHWERFNQILIDKLVNARMWRLGFQVQVKHYDSVQATDLSNRALVIVSLFDYDVGEPAIRRIGLADSDVPVLCLEPAAYPVLGMTVEGNEVGFGFRSGVSSIEFPHPGHPLSAGYSGKKDGFVRGLIGWGRPAEGAARIAHLPDHPEQAVLFAFNAEQPMSVGLAPARRVGLFLDPTAISNDLETVWSVFEAAVDWCAATESPAAINQSTTINTKE